MTGLEAASRAFAVTKGGSEGISPRGGLEGARGHTSCTSLVRPVRRVPGHVRPVRRGCPLGRPVLPDEGKESRDGSEDGVEETWIEWLERMARGYWCADKEGRGVRLGEAATGVKVAMDRPCLEELG